MSRWIQGTLLAASLLNLLEVGVGPLENRVQHLIIGCGAFYFFLRTDDDDGRPA